MSAMVALIVSLYLFGETVHSLCSPFYNSMMILKLLKSSLTSVSADLETIDNGREDCVNRCRCEIAEDVERAQAAELVGSRTAEHGW